MPVPFVLASQSPARLATLRAAGVEPRVIVSHVDEDAALARARAEHAAAGWGEMAFDDTVLLLARTKAHAVAEAHETDAIVLGCDSMLEIDGEILGKPGDPETARERWRGMRGRVGVLHTGHWLVDDRPDGSGATVGATASTTVRFAHLSDAEIDAYVATGEPLQVAGAFTVDSLGGPYVESIDGDFHAVVGVSLPLLRHLLASCEVAFHELWRDEVRG
ncbi:Maf family protein [Demequina zhanjiangensis]|uniref:Nucleoside triphosphate pyrophosphatase n=1 Tax=Demequina zhanjiangensis TaxID=3051659 RepID=A0ABT8G175_9MICO|nr:nucleoside triphosphate pyrophosphatase [Demequina sp. SYSU T00b26]MDN4472842.1 nucleoside triphosphate pyrophosphatase [Demequina sp. SYSU T00b26]